MENHWYVVIFVLGDRWEKVWAPHKAAAKILAQANQIRKGNQYEDVDKITKEHN